MKQVSDSLTRTLESSGELRCHHLNDQADTNAQHFVEEFRFRANEHCQIHENLLNTDRHTMYTTIRQGTGINDNLM